MNQGRAMYEAREYEEAHERFSRAIDLVERGVGELLLTPEEQAELYLLRGSALLYEDPDEAFRDPDIFHQAITDFEEAIDLQPRQALYRKVRGRMYMQCRFEDYLLEAREDFLHALELQPEDTDTLKHLGEILSREGNFEKAIFYLDRMLKIQPDIEGWLMRGVCYFRREMPDFEAAAADFGQALTLAPHLEELYVWRAQCFLEQGELDAAIAEYDRLIQRFPNRPAYYVDRGALRSNRDPHGALSDYNKALAIQPDALAYNNRAYYYLSQGNYPAAIADARAALQAGGSSAVAYATLAEIYARQEDRLRFYENLEKALGLYYEDVVEVLSNPAFGPYLKEPAFQEMIATFKLRKR
ncbi:MAG: tetratricopeptide repeat protein [Bacteroidia bacterium]|nr:tetratricopeptide repeat protein [Bacteroidia bacterium]